MYRTGIFCFCIKNWIDLLVILHLFTYVQGGEEQDIGVKFTTEPGDQVVSPGEDALLPCAASSRHPIRLSWRHSAAAQPTRDHAISTSDKYRKQLLNGTLSIENMSSLLAGQYQCVATVDGIGTIVSRVATVFLAEVPEVSGTPRSVVSVVEGVALLPCGIRPPARVALRVLPPAAAPDHRLYGPPRVHNAPPLLKLNVTWLKNGSPVRMESARVALTQSGALEIDPLRHHDAATYRCRVSLPHAHHTYKLSDEMELRVSSEPSTGEYPPRFVATPQPLTVLEGASVTFDCAAVGNPKPEIIWLSNGLAIDLSDLDSRFYLVGSGSLRVQAARAQDAGAYTCRAHSRLDSADHTTHLHVLTAPRVVAGGGGGGEGGGGGGAVSVARARGDVTLTCEAQGRPAPTVSWLKDGDPLTPNEHDIALVDGWSLRIQGVLRVDAGMFQCAALSPAGSASSSLRLLVLPPDTSDTSDKPHEISSDSKTNPVTGAAGTASNSIQDAFNSLISSGGSEGASGGAAQGEEERDFLGETSPAFTGVPLEYEDSVYPNTDSDNSLHAAEGSESVWAGGNATVVSAPRALRPLIVKHRFVTLSWEAPEHRAADVTGYELIYKVKGSKRERVSRGGALKHEMNVPGLQPNTTYLFSVVARTAHAVSPPAQTIEVHTPEEELTYGPPANVRADPLGPHAVRVSWAPPAALAPDTPPPTKYTLHYTEVESGREQFQLVEVEGCAAGGGCGWTLGGLRAATAYSVRVSAAAGPGAGGGGGAGAAVAVRTPSDAPAAPPANVSAVPTGATSLVVRWEAPPARTHRGPLTGYKVRYRLAPSPGGGSAPAPAPGPAPGRRKADSLTTPADRRQAELRDLDVATTYQVRVCAINANGSGPFSEWVSATTLQHQRDETRVPHQPPPLTTRAGRDWISVWWSDEGGAGAGAGASGGEGAAVVVRGYVVGWGLGVPDTMSRELPAHLHSHVIRNLESNSEYVISLRASNSLGLGPPVYATVRTKPLAGSGAGGDEDDDDEPDELDEEGDDDADGDEGPPSLIPPVGLKAIMLSGSTAVVYWTDPTLPKGQTVTDGRRYVVRWSGGGGRTRTFNATDLNCMLDDLRPYTKYEFTVKLIKGGRESAWSMVVSNTTLEAVPGSAPRELRAHPGPPPAHPARVAQVTWQPPLKPNGVLTGYVVMYAIQRTGGGEEWTAVAVPGGERTQARVDRLRPRTTYMFKVQARNSKGLGPFSAPLSYTTSIESGEGGGLAQATSAWLWASAGGACAVLTLAAALALSLCCRRAHHHPPLSPDTRTYCSTYQKSSASAGIKPPDLWIHHDQMELKHLDKGLHTSASKISSGSADGGTLMSSTLTLGRAGQHVAPPPGAPAAPAGSEYEPARHPAPPASLDRRHYVPTYVGGVSESRSGSEETCLVRASPTATPSPGPGGGGSGGGGGGCGCRRCDICDCCKPMTGVGVGVGCAATCDRRQLRTTHGDQSTPLLAGVAPLVSPQSSLASLAPLHPPPAPCGSGACPLGAACGVGGAGGGADVYACAARERGHYVAYEPLGHYTHRDSLSSETGPGGGSLPRRVPGPPGAMHSFALPDPGSDHSTPHHSHSLSRGGARDTSPYKKSASSSPGHIPNRLQLGGVGGGIPHCPGELEPLTPSRSTERLHREMQNLEGLMKDLSAITQHQFHC